MINNPLPTLTLDGWIYNKETIIEKLFIYFLASDTYQSNMLPEYVYSLKEIIQSSKPSIPLEDQIVKYLKLLYEPYFTIVEPIITIEETKTRTKLIIDINFVDEDGKKYNFQRILQMKDNDIENFQELLFNYKVIKKD